jgi:hypothetical protein
MLRLGREEPDQMKKIIQKQIEEARLRSRLNSKPYIVEPTGRGRIKCHADVPDLSCPRCRRRLLMRRRRAEVAAALGNTIRGARARELELLAAAQTVAHTLAQSCATTGPLRRNIGSARPMTRPPPGGNDSFNSTRCAFYGKLYPTLPASG